MAGLPRGVAAGWGVVDMSNDAFPSARLFPRRIKLWRLSRLQFMGAKIPHPSANDVRAIKAVKQNYEPTQEVLSLLEDFRLMVNDCIRIGLKFEAENHETPSMKKLSLLCYSQLKRYGTYGVRLYCTDRRLASLGKRVPSVSLCCKYSNPIEYTFNLEGRE